MSPKPPADFDLNAFEQHELVQFCRDPESGLTAIIAIHSTALGPATGGCRMWPYASLAEAATDAARLSRGMSYKNAIAGLPLGGGKAVIVGDPHKDKSAALFTAFGRFVDALSGRYITAEDVGVSVADMEVAATVTRYVAGLSTGAAPSGDPSPWTARGVLRGIEAAAKHRLGRDTLAGLTVAVQGVGHVGYALAELLKNAGAKLIVTDVYAPNVQRAVAELGATAVEPGAIVGVAADIFAPCALGASINDDSIGQLTATIVAGAANNQLARPDHGDALRKRNILYAPDYVINAGGMVSVGAEITGDVERTSLPNKVDNIGRRLSEIFAEADRSSEPTNVIADRLGERLIAAGRAAKAQAAE